MNQFTKINQTLEIVHATQCEIKHLFVELHSYFLEKNNLWPENILNQFKLVLRSESKTPLKPAWPDW